LHTQKLPSKSGVRGFKKPAGNKKRNEINTEDQEMEKTS